MIVPQDYNLDIETGGGKIDVADIKGRVMLKTSGVSNAYSLNGLMNGDGPEASLKTTGGNNEIFNNVH